MGILYKPFFRDSAFKELSIKDPSINITGYKPKYTAEREDDSATPVESQIEEIKKPIPVKNMSTPSKFSSKDEFRDVMTPIYESMLVKKGLNPTFAKALVAQDGLESAWGSKPSGSFNFGGIKGIGTTKKTREVIDGKDVYLNDSFRDFSSLEDYADFKINLLSNDRYKAFTGDISEFADRVHKGGYATDPNYSKALNKIIASNKHGGVIRFQQGGLAQGREWVKNWYENRTPELKKNVVFNQKFPIPVTGIFVNNLLANNLRLTSASVDPSKVPSNANGVYYRAKRKIYLREDSPSTAVHEWTHSSRPDPQIREIDKIKDFLGNSLYDHQSIPPDEYLDSSSEIYARLMQLRHALNIDPRHKFTSTEVDDLKKKYLKREFLFNVLEGPDGSTNSTTIFDKTGKIIQADPHIEGYKIIPEKSMSMKEYELEGTFNILDRYSTDGIKKLLNDVADISKKEDSTISAKEGIKIPKYQEPAGVLMTSSVKQWMGGKNRNYSEAKRNNREYPEFWDRLKNNKKSIPSWDNLEDIATHKLGYAGVDNKTIIYPEVQEINGKLTDFTRPPYSNNAGIDSALDTGNYTEIPSEEMAENFTKTYKQAFAGFSVNRAPKYKPFDIFNTKK